MPVSHIPDVLQRPTMWRLAPCIHQHHQRWQQSEEPPDLERFEQELHDHVMAIERALLADELSRYEGTADEVAVEGLTYRQSLASTQTSFSAAGPVSVTRHLYRPAGRGSQSICPLEWRAGMVEGRWTPRAARQGAFVMAHLTPRESAMLLEELGGMRPSVRTLERFPQTLSARYEAKRTAWEATRRASATVPEEAVLVAVALDGVMTPMATAEPEGEQADSQQAEPPPPACPSSDTRHDREAGWGTVTLYDAEGTRLATVR